MKISRKIKVLIVDDSLVFREVLIRGMSQDPGIEVVGAAADVYKARDMIIELQPDVLTLDIQIPRMNGVDFLKQLMPQYPLPVVVVSSISESVFDALNAGAVDFVNKPDFGRQDSVSSFINEVIIKIKIASTARVGSFKKETPVSRSPLEADKKNDIIIAIGASTGGTEAIYNVVKDFPRDIPPVVIVQHMPPVFTKMYADRLNNSCRVEVKEAEDGDELKAGRVLIAPGNFQLKVAKNSKGYYVKVFQGERVNGHSPSVDVMFNSVAEVAGSKAIGVILTGMGNDGAKGILNMRNKGAYTIGQDEKTCVVYGMPMVAYNIGGVIKQCSLNLIANEVINVLKSRNIL